MEDYNDIRNLISPKCNFHASKDLRDRVVDSIKCHRRKKLRVRWFWTLLSTCAAAVLLLFVLLPTGVSAKEILTQTIETFINFENIEMVVEVRTRSVENFRYIDISEDFVSHHARIEYSDSTVQWRVDKGERIAMGNGRDTYTWIPKLNIGWHIKGSDSENVLGYLETLLRPKDILETELEHCISNTNAEYNVTKKENEIILTIHSEPQGNFENPYLLNTSIMESESIRRYVIDSDSKRLKSVTVSVISGKREVAVLKVSDIIYNKQSDNILSLPTGIRFVEFDNHLDGLRGLSAEEAASTFLNAFENWDNEIIDKMIMHEMQDSIYREYYQGAHLDSIGSSFTSGLGNSVFVPYKLKLRNGTIQRHNIALQKTDSGSWVVIGGL